MTVLKKGDRVKVTYEATYTEFTPGSSGGRHWLNGMRHSAPADATIEKLPDPLPTAPGSYIRIQTTPGRYRYRSLGVDSRWYAPGQANGVLTENLDDGYEVVYDAGAGK